jgi:N utilization substance protein A
VTTLEEFATCADWELAGGYTVDDEGKRTKDDGVLEPFDVTLEEAQTLIMSARIACGMIDASELESAEADEAEGEAEDEEAAPQA